MHSRKCHCDGGSFSRDAFNNESVILSRDAIVTHPLCILRMRFEMLKKAYNGNRITSEATAKACSYVVYDDEKFARNAYRKRRRLL